MKIKTQTIPYLRELCATECAYVLWCEIFLFFFLLQTALKTADVAATAAVTAAVGVGVY